jgi:MFS family permease
MERTLTSPLPAAPVRPRSPTTRAFEVGLCTFGILSLELALIRWSGGQIRIIAYFANLVLLAAFLGMGLGVVLGRRRPGLIHAALPALVVVSAVLAFSVQLGLVSMTFPDPSIFMWIEDQRAKNLGQFIGVTLFIAALFWAVATAVALAAAPLGRLFDELQPLRAYTADIAGSLAGIIAVTLISAAGAPPWQWLALGVLPILYFSRTPLSLASAVVILALAWFSARDALFSPYNRIELTPTTDPYKTGEPLRRDWVLQVNRDYFQRIGNFSSERIAEDSKLRNGDVFQAVYELPFRLRPGGTSGLIVGAGTGNDVAGALRVGYQSITAVEIDPVILELGHWLHPENPYGDPRVHPVNDDARAYFQRHPDTKFDVISYGLLDSHAMFSAMSSLRLDNYVYTVEGIRAGWEHVREGGILSISFSTVAGPWIEHRLMRTIREATGLTPVVVFHRMDSGASFIVGRSIDLNLVPARIRKRVTQPPIDESVRMPTDDWPFLYIRPGTIPYGYLTVLALIGISAIIVIRRAYRASVTTEAPAVRGFDWAMFLMGAGFMLLETRMVTSLSLLFGSTWIVNAFVFGGVLAMVLLANLWVSKRTPQSLERWFIPLLASVVLTWIVGAGALTGFGLTTRGIIGGLLFALPIGFAGIIVATLLKRSTAPALALAANLMGAVLGGILEYSSMFLGLTFVGVLSLLCYVGAFVALRSRTGHLTRR